MKLSRFVGCVAVSCAVSANAQPVPFGDVMPCGAAAIAMAMSLLDAEYSNADVEAAVREDGSSTFADLRRIAESRGLFAVPVRLNPTQLSDLKQVAILQLVTRPRADAPWREHFVVYAGPGGAPGQVCLFDPIAEMGRGNLPFKVVAEKWTGAAMLLSRTPVNLESIAAPFPERGWRRYGISGLAGASGTWLVIGLATIGRGRRRGKHT